MGLLSSLSIARRLYLASGVLCLALAGVAAYAWISLGAISAMARGTGDMRMPQLERMGELELNLTRMPLQVRQALLARTSQEQRAALDEVAARRTLIVKIVDEYEKALFTKEGRERFAPLPPLLARFLESAAADLKLIEEGQKAEAFAHLVDKTTPVRNELLALITETVKFQEEALRREVADVQVRASTILVVLVSLVGVTVLGLGLFSWDVARVLRRRVAMASGVAQRVSEGDLTTAVADDARDEFTPLLAALRQMQVALSRVVSNVRGNSESVATASAQIAQGNQDLSSRTEQQAGALQQTAATMDQLGTTVRHNADSARQANQLAQGATDVASRGGQVVGEVVVTMKGINESSKKIADIISVIDGIAFQTNILALNAAVEAARAGEQGRGFAVVAAEVRSLAQRSAQAAREIKSLITGSVDQVEQGTALVTQAGQTMDEIVVAIRRVGDIVAEISSASVEQSAGVTQVGQAVSQMDTVTQQNAALVEESAAAAESLRQQAQALVQAVSVFRVAAA